ncbi:hypothetical protein HMJ29_00415 [Hymenobacter taeanensis]|uniref:DUF748 domain-containing protein n=1 Tax=Hymenobacter taeanensis TaxID=2735321 RepID=A0A6M6BC05_9BACT|nr:MULTISPECIES: hypothetical protein [Hymenobacter]QJX45480.1 hypothetical protein HMJ29_00415 [Hymenobacter taeanensis]UOQ81272.1 hypothetical protein MUN83_00280 [Hymenobacter sp. 5414T-23]
MPKRTHWGWWLLGGLCLLGIAAIIALHQLDPWLRRKAEQQVATASRGRYHLHIGSLQTSLWDQTLAVRGLWLDTNPAISPTDSARFPRVKLAVGRLDVRGIGLLALLKKGVVPIDSVVLDAVALQLAAMPATAGSSQPLYQQLPVEGIRVGHFRLRQAHGTVGPLQQPLVQLSNGQLQVHDILLSAAGAADAKRIGYASALAGEITGLAVRVPGHQVKLMRGRFSSEQQQLLLDSLLVHPTRPINDQQEKTTRISMVMPRLRLTGLDAALLARKHLRMDTLQVSSPKLALTLPTVKPPSLHVLLAPYLQECRLQRLEITGGTLRIAGVSQAPVAGNMRAIATNIQVLPRNAARPAVYYAEAWSVWTGVASLRMDAPYYNLSWQQLRADTRPGTLRLTGIRLVPTMSVVAMARSKGHQAAHIMVKSPEMRVTGIDYRAAQKQRVLQVGSIIVPQTQMYTRSDGRFRINPARSVMTPEALGQLPFQFNVRQLRFQRVTIQLAYRAPRDPTPGTMSLNRLSISLHNITNNPHLMGPRSPMTGEATGWIQDRCFAKLSLQANLLDRSGAHTVQGVFRQAPLSILNSMTVPTRGIAIKSGHVKQIRFSMALNQQAASGTMWARYTDLKLQLLNQKERPGLLKRVETSVVNGIFIRDDNPRKPGQPLKPGQMTSGRERRSSVFTLWRQGLVSGMLNSAGVPAKLAKKLSESE